MIKKIVRIAEEASGGMRTDSELASHVEATVQAQFPRFLMISPIDRSSQDLQLFGMVRGDAFHGTRVPRMPLLLPASSHFLLGGPAAYNREFPKERGVILTFEQDEPEEIIRESLDNLMIHPDIKGIPIIAFRVDYELGRARIIPHGKGRNYEAENRLLAHLHRPDVVDENTLVLMCSDSRIHPPSTPQGLPMVIQTLGGYIPKFTQRKDETSQLNEFFAEWLSTKSNPRHILIIVHGNFEGEGPSCGAALASLNPDSVKNPLLNSVITELQMVATQFEDHSPRNAEERVKALSLAIKENLLSYPPVREFVNANPRGFIDILLMDTVTNAVSPADF
jgi:carbonic anhydrase